MGRSPEQDQERQSSTSEPGAAEHWGARARILRALLWTWAALIAWAAAAAVEVVAGGRWPAVGAYVAALLLTLWAVRETARMR